MAIQLATRFDGNVDEMFKNESKLPLITNQDYKWVYEDTVVVYKVSTAEMNDYGRRKDTGVSRYGKVLDLDTTTQEMQLKKDRSFTFVIDTMDEQETALAVQAATALARQIREKVIPEIDQYTYNKMVTSAGTVATPVTLTADNIYSKIIKANAVLDDNEVPEVDRAIIVTPETYLLMKQSKDIVLNTDIGEDMRIRGVISNLDGLLVIKVPSSRLPENFGFMVSHKSATVAPLRLSEYKVHNEPMFYSGSLVEGRVVYDAFVLDNKKKGIYYQANKVAV